MTTRNAILLFMYNQTPEQLALTQETYASLIAQDIDGGIDLYIVNNGSTAPTVEWLTSLNPPDNIKLKCFHLPVNESPVLLYNRLLGIIFDENKHPFVLCVPNDVIAPPNLYSEMVKFPAGLLSAALTEDRNFPRDMTATGVHDRANLAVCLLRKWAYDGLVARFGSFYDERYFCYASDCDIRFRFSACGIVGRQLDILCYHYGSGSWRLAPPFEAYRMTRGADEDRARFFEKWGFTIGSPEYEALAVDPNFRG